MNPDDRLDLRARFVAILSDLEAYLQSEREEGVTAVAARRDLVEALASRPATPAIPATPSPRYSGSLPSEKNPADGLGAIARAIAACTRCPLHQTRTRTVPGQGNPSPELVFIGEGPGAEEDRQGLAFVGAAGQLLTKMIAAMGFSREEVFIANIVKCRPPGNRVPTPEEAAACLPFLHQQLALLKPKVIVTLGATALKYLLNLDQAAITKIRGHWLEFQGIPVMPTFHPAYLLRNPASKRDAWSDLKAVLARLGRPPPR